MISSCYEIKDVYLAGSTVQVMISPFLSLCLFRVVDLQMEMLYVQVELNIGMKTVNLPRVLQT